MKEEDRMLVLDHSSSLDQYLSNLNMQWITKGYCGNADSDAVDLEWGLRFCTAENLQGLPILLFHWAHWVSKTLDTTSPLLMFLQQLRVAHMHSASGTPASSHVEGGKPSGYSWLQGNMLELTYAQVGFDSKSKIRPFLMFPWLKWG